MVTPTLALLVVSALLGAAMSAIIGMGGGIALLGVMTALLPAATVVPIHGIVQMSSNMTRALVFLKHVHWRIFAIYVVPASLGVYVATLVWEGDKLGWFKPFIGLFIISFLIWRRYAPKLRNIPLWLYAPVGASVGFLAIFVGATGPFLAPFFLRDDFRKEQVIATKAACQLCVHLWKIPAFLSLGFDYLAHSDLLLALILAVIVGTFAGKGILSRLSETLFLRLFKGALLGIACYLVCGPLFH